VHDALNVGPQVGGVNGGAKQHHDRCQGAEHRKIVQAQLGFAAMLP
jgi:hypothetical protein